MVVSIGLCRQENLSEPYGYRTFCRGAENHRSTEIITGSHGRDRQHYGDTIDMLQGLAKEDEWRGQSFI